MNTIRFLFRAGITVLAFLLFGCASSAKKGKDFSAYAPMGLVSVVSNYDINWLGERTFEKQDLIGSLVRTTLKIKTDDTRVRISKAGELVNEADSILRKILSEAGVFRLEDKGRIINSATYAAAVSKRTSSTPVMIAADGYKPLDYRNKNFASELFLETGVRSILYITFTFNKEMVSGFMKTGMCRARVIMDTRLITPQGKIIYRKVIETQSRDKIEVKNELYSNDELMDLFREAIGEACYRFAWEYTGQPAL
jgi:hypothetical protein